MMKNRNQKPDELGERISAYLDGELSAEERTKTERLLSEDSAAQQLATELQQVGKACAGVPCPAFRDLTPSVLSEAIERKAAGEGFVDRLEPEGEFGLPFGRSSRGWAWAGVAVAASLVIGFYGRPDPPSARQQVAQSNASAQPSIQPVAFSRAVQQAIPQMRRAMPQLRVVRIQTTPAGKQRLEQLLAQQGIQLRPAATEEPVSKSDGQLMLVSAERPRLANLMNDLEKEASIFRVEADRKFTAPSIGSPRNSKAIGAGGGDSALVPKGQVTPMQSVAIRVTIHFSPGKKPTIQLPSPQVKNVARGHVPVLFVIQARQP